MDSVLTLSAVDHGFDPWSDQTKDNKIDICCFSDDHSGWYGIRLMFMIEATCLRTDCCSSEVAL
jgi:hypothetical protein